MTSTLPKITIGDELLTDKQVRQLERRFKKLDADGNGSLSFDEFLSIPELALNPLLERVISILDTNKDEKIEFEEFVAGLSKFSQKGNAEDKIKFAFQIYDLDMDGYIGNGELFQVLKMMVGKNLSELQLQQIVDKTIREADLDKDGKLSFDEFQHALDLDTESIHELEQKLTLTFE